MSNQGEPIQSVQSSADSRDHELPRIPERETEYDFRWNPKAWTQYKPAKLIRNPGKRWWAPWRQDAVFKRYYEKANGLRIWVIETPRYQEGSVEEFGPGAVD